MVDEKLPEINIFLEICLDFIFAEIAYLYPFLHTQMPVVHVCSYVRDQHTF